MINVLAHLTLTDMTIPMFGSVDEENRKLTLHCSMTDLSPTILRDSDALFFARKFTVTLTDTDAKSYTLYNVIFTQSQMAIAGPGVMTLNGVFDRLIREPQANILYGFASFSFAGIEKFFPLTEFQSEHSDTDLSFSIHIPDAIEHDLSDGLKCSVQPAINGRISGNLYDLRLEQSQRISLHSTSKLSVDDWIGIIGKVKNYFEFIIEQEIQISDVVFADADVRMYQAAALLADRILEPRALVKDVKDNPYYGTPTELLSGLAGWFCSYDEYERAISIWLKTIYNLNVSAEDLFTWRAQAFELLCTIHPAVHVKAIELMMGRGGFPNLKNNLAAVNAVFNYGYNHTDYYTDAKEVRNYLTHNNPEKVPDDRERKNSFNLIHHYLRRAMASVFGIDHIGSALVLAPSPAAG